MSLPQVVHLCTELSVGGAENHLLTLLRDMTRDQRYFPHVVAFRDAIGAMRSLKTDFEQFGIPVHILNQNSAWDPRGIWNLGMLLKEIGPSVLHTHLFRGDIIGPPLGALLQIPVRLSTVHNIEPRFRNSFFSKLYRCSYYFDHGIIAISNSVARALQTFLRIPVSKIRTIYYGFEEDTRWIDRPIQNLRSEFGFDESHFVIGNIGRIGEQKGQRYLIEALALLKADLPNAKLLIVGTPEPDRTFDSLLSMVKTQGLENDVVFAGYQDDIRSIMNSIDVFALPSLWEGFGLVLLEAMNMKKPIVASNVDAISEVIQGGVHGILIPPADAESLKNAILDISSSPELRRKMAEAGPLRVQRFSPRQNLEETISLYNQFI